MSKSFIRKSWREKIFYYLKTRPDANIYDLYFEFSKELKNGNLNKNTLHQYKYQWDHIYNIHDIEIAKMGVCVILYFLDKKVHKAERFTKAESDVLDYVKEWCEYEVYKKKKMMEVLKKL